MPTTEATPPSTEVRDCPLCGTPLNPTNPNECPKCDWVLGYRREQGNLQKSGGRDVAALLLSVVPGAGHIYKGQTMPGIILLGGTVLIAIVVIATVSATVGASLALVPVYWLAVMIHAYWAEDVALARMEAQAAAAPQR